MIHYDEYGNSDNPTVVLINDAFYVDEFHKQYAFADCFHLVVPHLPGAGRAAKENYEPTETVHALAELIMSLGGRAALIGHALGAELALALTVRCEPLVSRTVLLSPSIPDLARVPEKAKIIRVPTPFSARFCAYRRRMTREQAKYFCAYIRDVPERTRQALAERRIALLDLNGYSNVSVPMLAVCGALEKSAVRHSVRTLGERNPRCETRVLRGAGRMYPVQKAGKLNPILIDFLTNAF